MAYALLAGLPPQVGLYAATIPLLVYAVLGTSRQLAVGPVAIVSLLTASALAPIATGETSAYIAAAALLALLVGVIHLVLGIARLGWVVNLLSHSVLIGFTAAAAAIIGVSQIKHLLGIEVPRRDHVYETLIDIARTMESTHLTTLAIGLGSVVALVFMRRFVPRIPGALLIVVLSTAISTLADLPSRGVRVVGDIPAGLPAFAIPSVGAGTIRDLAPTAIVITLIGFVESIAVAKVYARRHRYEIDPNAELIALGSANIAAGLTGAYPVGGGFARTAVNDSAGARTPMAAVFTAALVIVVLAIFTPAFEQLPQAALAAIILVAVRNLIDVAEMRHVLTVKRTDGIGMVVATVATLALGIETGIAIAVISSMLVVFARMSRPHTALLGRIPGTTSYRNINRFPGAEQVDGIRMIRIDAAVSFVNAQWVKRLLLNAANEEPRPEHVVLDCSGINDLDATGADALSEVIEEFESLSTAFHLCDIKGPVRDVLHRSGIWGRLEGRIHATAESARIMIEKGAPNIDLNELGIDEPRIGS
jgi:SulP family sulfate permease